MNLGLDRRPHRDPPPMTGKQHDVVVERALDGVSSLGPADMILWAK